MSAISAIFGTFARTHSISLKLYQNIEDIIVIKNHEKKIGDSYGHLAQIAIWNVKNCQNFNIADIWHFWQKWAFFSDFNCIQTTYAY